MFNDDEKRRLEAEKDKALILIIIGAFGILINGAMLIAFIGGIL